MELLETWCHTITGSQGRHPTFGAVLSDSLAGQPEQCSSEKTCLGPLYHLVFYLLILYKIGRQTFIKMWHNWFAISEDCVLRNSAAIATHLIVVLVVIVAIFSKKPTCQSFQIGSE